MRRGERSFAHYAGAPRLSDKQALLDRLDLFARSRAMLIGYYPLMTRLQEDLPEVLAAIREDGLPHGDGCGRRRRRRWSRSGRSCRIWIFTFRACVEAAHQTGEAKPQAMIAAYREAGATGWLGIKLGERGAIDQSAVG